tara:strand:+ start:1471 stop:1647 length:177 start_codon:yes stop_codon:yes gene_type:complete
MGKPAKQAVVSVEPSTGTKICANCKEPTQDFYPILGKNQTGVRCSDCQERWVRQSNDS